MVNVKKMKHVLVNLPGPANGFESVIDLLKDSKEPSDVSRKQGRKRFLD